MSNAGEQETSQSSPLFTGLHRVLELVVNVIQQKHNGMEVLQPFSLLWDFVRTYVKTWRELSGL